MANHADLTGEIELIPDAALNQMDVWLSGFAALMPIDSVVPILGLACAWLAAMSLTRLTGSRADPKDYGVYIF